MHLVALQFDNEPEMAKLYAWAIQRGWLPALAPQYVPETFSNRPPEPQRQPAREDGQGEFNAANEPVCPVHGGDDKSGMLESKKEKGGYYCGRKTNGVRCGWEWSPKRGFYNTSGRGAARR